MNPFNRDIGIHQGRIASPVASEGAYVYELGHALLQDANIAIGDSHIVAQTIAIDPQTKVIRPRLRIVTPDRLPTNSAWEVSCWLDGAKLVARRLRRSKRVLVLDDICISTFGAVKAPATAVLSFRLELVA